MAEKQESFNSGDGLFPPPDNKSQLSDSITLSGAYYSEYVQFQIAKQQSSLSTNAHCSNFFTCLTQSSPIGPWIFQQWRQLVFLSHYFYYYFILLSSTFSFISHGIKALKASTSFCIMVVLLVGRLLEGNGVHRPLRDLPPPPASVCPEPQQYRPCSTLSQFKLCIKGYIS